MINFAFLDSGVGGLPYLKYLKEKCPDANCVYIADTKNFPYGEKNDSDILKNSCECVKKIIAKWSPNAIVIACNTISVVALDIFRKIFLDTKFIGTVPAIKPAALLTKTHKIGLLATNKTVENSYTKDLEMKFAADCKIICRGDPELISFIEKKYFSATDKERINAVRPAVDFFKENDCDVIVLACTHFLNMADYIQKCAGNSIKVIDSRDGVARHALELEAPKIISQNIENQYLFVTALDENKNDVYKSFCKENEIIFGGLLE